MNQTDILLFTPPFVQLNTPYPATPALVGFLQGQGINAVQSDLGIATLLKILSTQGLADLFAIAQRTPATTPLQHRIFALQAEYTAYIEPVIAFLQGKDSTLAHSICNGLLPQGPRFDVLPDMNYLFGSLGTADRAKYLATLFIEDIGDFISECIDSNFGFSRYAEQLGRMTYDFSPLHTALQQSSYITDAMCKEVDKAIQQHQPEVVGFSIPFPGNLYGGLKAAQYIKQHYPDIPIIMGGGFANTELRQLNEPRLFDYVDYVCLDDGEQPLLQLLKNIKTKAGYRGLVRTYYRHNGRVTYANATETADFSHQEIEAPDYSGLPLDSYISVLEMANPMHRLWSDGRWNKMPLAHGCYWHKCAFCDVSLDYIRRYSIASAPTLADRIAKVVQQTGNRGFHFVDEAAPPQVLRNLALELLRRRMKITWWTNIRFEKAFSADLCRLLAASGCIAVSGGLEVASDRLLTLMNKGVTIEQVSQVCSNMQQAGIMVHAYLMYGFPTQTAQETIDSLEVVRQLFENQLVQSAFWHRFAMTVHSPTGMNPEQFGVKKTELHSTFAQNDLDFTDPTGCQHEAFSFGLSKALYNYMHDMCFEYQLSEWFDFRTPPTTLPPQLIYNYLQYNKGVQKKDKGKVVWIGGNAIGSQRKKGRLKITFAGTNGTSDVEVQENEAKWLLQMLKTITPDAKTTVSLADLRENYNTNTPSDFDAFFISRSWKQLQKAGLLIV